jgi:hypothetical protein
VAFAYFLNVLRSSNLAQKSNITKYSNLDPVVWNLRVFCSDPWMGHIPAVNTKYPREQKLQEDRYFVSDHTL